MELEIQVMDGIAAAYLQENCRMIRVDELVADLHSTQSKDLRRVSNNLVNLAGDRNNQVYLLVELSFVRILRLLHRNPRQGLGERKI